MSVTRTEPARRDPEATRRRLVEAAFWEIYRKGFRASSLETILERAGVTKGALYHHFPNKTALGYAVVEDVLSGFVEDHWLAPLSRAEDPLLALREVLLALPETSASCARECGCPINNLTQEMSAADEGFRVRLNALFARWQAGIADALRRGQERGLVSPAIHPQKSAAFIVAAVEGSMGMMKHAQSQGLFETCVEGLLVYLDTLRVSRAA